MFLRIAGRQILQDKICGLFQSYVCCPVLPFLIRNPSLYTVKTCCCDQKKHKCEVNVQFFLLHNAVIPCDLHLCVRGNYHIKLNIASSMLNSKYVCKVLFFECISCVHVTVTLLTLKHHTLCFGDSLYSGIYI